MVRSARSRCGPSIRMGTYPHAPLAERQCVQTRARLIDWKRQLRSSRPQIPESVIERVRMYYCLVPYLCPEAAERIEKKNPRVPQAAAETSAHTRGVPHHVPHVVLSSRSRTPFVPAKGRGAERRSMHDVNTLRLCGRSQWSSGRRGSRRSQRRSSLTNAQSGVGHM